jgi:hypothetical protein
MRLDRQSVHPLTHEITERGIDHPLALDPALSREGVAFDLQ